MPNKDKKQLSIGIDIGGTKMLGILYDKEKILEEYALATPKDNIEHFLVMVKALLEPLIDKAGELKTGIKGLGVSMAGVFDNSGNIIKAPNIAILNGVNIADKIGGLVDFPVKAENDANCFVLAEKFLGTARKYDSVYGLIVGTGIGGGWWLNDALYQGKYRGDGEPGEMIIDFSENIKLEEAYHRLSQNNPANLAEEAYRGDVLAEKTFSEIGDLLGKAMANITNLIGPEAFVLGGGVVESSELFLPSLKKSWRDNTVSPELKKRTKILKSKLGKPAGAIGAALLFETL